MFAYVRYCYYVADSQVSLWAQYCMLTIGITHSHVRPAAATRAAGPGEVLSELRGIKCT